MPGPFDRFNDRAKRVLALAQDEAIRLNHNYIGAEHLLLALVREGEGVAARALTSLGVELSKLRTTVEFRIGRGDSTSSPSEITLHPRVKKIIELAVDEARKLGHGDVGTEHLLLGIVREGESVAKEMLESLGVTLEKVRHQVMTTMAQPSPRARQATFGGRDESAAIALGYAHGEAMRLGHDWIGTEHVLLGILKAGGTGACAALISLGVTHEAASVEIANVVPRRDAKPAGTALTPRVHTLVGYARGFADGHGIPYSAQTLLLALVADPEGVGAQVLSRMGATPEKVRRALGF